MSHALLLAALLGCGGTTPTAPAPDAAPASRGTDPDVKAAVSLVVPNAWAEAGGVRYLEVRTGGATPEASVPVIVALHGNGSDPLHFAMWFQELAGQARLIVPEGPVALGDERGWLTTPITGDAARLSAELRERAAALDAFLAALQHEAPLLLGYAQGGMVAAALALHHPGRVREVWMAGGALPEPLLADADAPAATTLHVLHGADDTIVAPDGVATAVAGLAARGARATWTPLPGVGHLFTPAMFADRLAALGLPPPTVTVRTVITQDVGPDGAPGEGTRPGPDGAPITP